MGNIKTLALIDDLLQLSAETLWVEFKKGNNDAHQIGKLISALSNSARLVDKQFAYVVWGIRDADHVAIGTTFEPSTQKQKGQPLELWLTQYLRPGISFSFESLKYQGVKLVLLKVPAAANTPVEFNRTPYIRIGSATLRLSDHPERQKELWEKLSSSSWETGLALQLLDGNKILEQLDYTCYFNLTGQPEPKIRHAILDRLQADQLIQQDIGGHWNVTNLGAILFARRLDDFPSAIARKAIRFVAHDGEGRADTVIHRKDMQGGYAVALNTFIDYMGDLLPQNEQINGAFREARPIYPIEAIRELVANALIHQDMTIRGAGPLVEMFSGRLEITNPGSSLIEPDRLIDSPPRSRNEKLASLMRRMRLCEEQGTGIDKVIVAVESHQLPPPDFRSEGEFVRVKLFAPRSFAKMTSDERVRACYQHATLKYVSGGHMKNSTLCNRFGIDLKNAAQASAVIRRSLDAGLIKYADPAHPRAGYIPSWA